MAKKCHNHRLHANPCPVRKGHKVEIISEPIFYGDLVYKFKRIVGKSNFSDQFKKIVKRYIHHIYINCWFPLYRWSVMKKKTDNQYPPPTQYLEIGGGGVLVTCIYITEHMQTGNQQLMWI